MLELFEGNFDHESREWTRNGFAQRVAVVAVAVIFLCAEVRIFFSPCKKGKPNGSGGGAKHLTVKQRMDPKTWPTTEHTERHSSK